MEKLLPALAGLTDERHMHKLISERLATFGDVTNLKILDVPEQDSRMILVTMDSQQAATSAINHLGLLSFGERSLAIAVPNGHS